MLNICYRFFINENIKRKNLVWILIGTLNGLYFKIENTISLY